jgi:membrane protein implicated in regulation of membrane protease activity
MILIAILLLVSLYLFWHFDQKRKTRTQVHRKQKREALTDLLEKIRNKDKSNTVKTKGE